MSSSLGRTIRSLREARGWSQERLHKESGVSKKAIFDIETGLTTQPHTTTLHRLASALEVTVESILSRPYAPSQYLPEAPDAVEKLNSPMFREQMLSRFIPELSLDPIEVTKFIDHIQILRNFSWLRDAELIQTTTLEYSEIWFDRAGFIPLECTYLRKISEGKAVNRLFLFEPDRLTDDIYLTNISKVLLRHKILGFYPKVCPMNSAQDLHAEIGMECHSFVIMDTNKLIVMNYPRNHAPLYIRSANTDFCERASNVFLRFWRASHDADRFLALRPIAPDLVRAVENEAAEVDAAFRLMPRL